MRRSAGVGAIKSKNLAQAKYKDKGAELAEVQLQQLSRQLGTFRENLEEFASRHKSEIRRDARFRQQFQEMCAAIGVDPLASSKGFWSEMLGVGDFYYELAVQVVEVCLATSHRNGGLMELSELQARLMKSRGKKSQQVTQDDLVRAIKKLRVLGAGFELVPLSGSGRFLVQAVPAELSRDHTAAIQQAQETGYVTISQLTSQGWEQERAERTVNHLLEEGLAWVDEGASEPQYWFPAIFSAHQQQLER